jgi:transcriptional regulator with XRE-family HTH domain
MSVVSTRRRQKSWQIADKIASLIDGMSGEELGERLRRLARMHGLGSDEDAARHVGVSYRQYQRWLSGVSQPRTSSLKQIAEAFDVSLAELVGEPDPSQLDRIEQALSRQEAILEGLAAALSAERADRGTAAAVKARQQAGGSTRAADRRRRA